jgi:hypothetical protein
MPFQKIIDAWMAFAEKLGDITSSIFLTIFYFVLFTPISLFAKLTGKKFLYSHETTNSTWKEKEKGAGDFNKPY